MSLQAEGIDGSKSREESEECVFQPIVDGISG
jgi:hypothetical protein